jgi:hypothetical protein
MLARRYADAHIELACGYESDKESSKSFATRLGELTDTDVLKLNLNPAELELFGITTSIALQSSEGFDLIMPLYKFLRGETLIEVGTRNAGTFTEQRGISKADAIELTEKVAEARKAWPEKLKNLKADKLMDEVIPPSPRVQPLPPPKPGVKPAEERSKDEHVPPPPGPPMGAPKPLPPPKPGPSKSSSTVPPLPGPVKSSEPQKTKLKKDEGEIDG